MMAFFLWFGVRVFFLFSFWVRRWLYHTPCVFIEYASTVLGLLFHWTIVYESIQRKNEINVYYFITLYRGRYVSKSFCGSVWTKASDIYKTRRVKESYLECALLCFSLDKFVSSLLVHGLDSVLKMKSNHNKCISLLFLLISHCHYSHVYVHPRHIQIKE